MSFQSRPVVVLTNETGGGFCRTIMALPVLLLIARAEGADEDADTL